MFKLKKCLIVLLVVFLVFAGGCVSSRRKQEIASFNLMFYDHLQFNEEVKEVKEAEEIITEDETAEEDIDEEAEEKIEVPPEMSRAERVMRSLAEAFPVQIDRAEFRNGDWAVLLWGTWFYYADGRLLPENKLAYIDSYTRHHFFYYPRELPPWREATPEQVERFREWEANRRANPPRRSPYFHDTLWQIHSREEALRQLRSTRFLGFTINIHHMVLNNLMLVEQYILAAGRADPRIQAWINSIHRVEHWSWRNIAGTQSRSNHSYGIAIDILPRSFGGKHAYWLWTSRDGIDWWTIPHNKRWHPPDAVIKAFEKFGFIWGGKWLQFDTIHFEYRPEILIFNGMPPVR